MFLKTSACRDVLSVFPASSVTFNYHTTKNAPLCKKTHKGCLSVKLSPKRAHFLFRKQKSQNELSRFILSTAVSMCRNLLSIKLLSAVRIPELLCDLPPLSF